MLFRSSKKNNDARRERLHEFDLSDAEIGRLRGPVGLYIGSKTPPEIAVAILAEMARMLDYHVLVVDPREEYANGWDVNGVALDRGMPDDVVAQANLDGHSALVALTHDPKLDDLALMEALKSPAFYVGAIGSKKKIGRAHV